MKNLKTILFALSVLLVVACGNNKQGTAVNTSVAKQAIPVVDVTKNYPKKEIVLQDIADVEYVPLETRDDVLIAGKRRIRYISKDTIIISNAIEKDILFFNGQGKFLHSFNKKGQSGREYLSIIEINFDTVNKEVYIYDVLGGKHRIQVYSEKGTYKRTLTLNLDILDKIQNYNNSKLLAYEYLSPGNANKKINTTPFLFIDKQTGKVDTLKTMNIKDRENVICQVMKKDIKIRFVLETSFIKYLRDNKSVILDELSCDTIFEYTKEKKLLPICIKTPKLKEQKDPKLIVSVLKATEKRFFLHIMPKDYTLDGYTLQDIRNGKFKYPKGTYLMVNRETAEVSEYSLVNKDISDSDFKVSLSSGLLNVYELKELLEEGKLKGKLKEIAENLREEDNPVLMKVTFKN